MGCILAIGFVMLVIAIAGISGGHPTGVTIGVIIIALFIVLIVIAFVMHDKEKRRAEQHGQFVRRKFPKFNQSVFFQSTAVLLDQETSRLFVSDGTSYGIYPLEKVVSVSLLIDNQEVANAGAVGGAAVGGVLAGGSGAIIGAMMAGPRKGKIKSIHVKLLIDDHHAPLVDIPILDGDVVDEEEKKRVSSALGDLLDVIRMAKARNANGGQFSVERGPVELVPELPEPPPAASEEIETVAPPKPRQAPPTPEPPPEKVYEPCPELGDAIPVAGVVGLRKAVANRRSIILHGIQANQAVILLDVERPSWEAIRALCAKHQIVRLAWKAFD